MRNNRLTIVSILLMAATAFAGCTGDADTGQDDDENVLPTEGTGTLLVSVTNELFEPLEGAEVTVHETQENRTTNANGEARFGNLDPDRYTVFASKLGFLAGAKTLQVQEGKESQVQFQLVAVPPPAEPFLQELIFDGFISCSVGLKPIQSADHCGATDPNAISKHNFTLSPGLSAGAVVLEFGQAGLNLGQTLAVTWSSPAGIKPYSFQGESPLRQDWEFTDNDTFTQTESEGVLEVRAASGDATGTWNGASYVVWQQPYKMYVGLFFNGMPVPDGYTPKPEG